MDINSKLTFIFPISSADTVANTVYLNSGMEIPVSYQMITELL